MLFQAMLCFLRSSFRCSAVWSASALTASCTCISSTRWVPPLRSRPRRMLSLKFLTRSAPLLGKSMMPNTQIRRMTTMTTVRAVSLFFMGIFTACLIRLLLLAFAGGRSGCHGGHRAARHLNLDVVGFHPQHYCIAIERDDGSDDAARRHDVVPILQTGEHFRRLLALPLHGEEQKKIKNAEDEQDGKESQHRVGGRRPLKKQVENHVVNQTFPIGHYPASGESERTHLRYSGNEPNLIACLISRMMSRYRWMLCRVASTEYKISEAWKRWRR